VGDATTRVRPPGRALETGDAAQIVELSTAELAKAVKRKEPLIAQLRDDGILLAGREPKLGK
jgi:hypothetical protein